MSVVEATGIVTREVKYGDTSRILTVLTREFGKISVLAGGVRTNKSGMLASTQLFSYTTFNLFKGRDKSLYKINSGEVINSFSNIKNSLEAMAYASYFCEMANWIIQEEAPDENQLSLLLNTMYVLSENKLPYQFIKAVYEFRTLGIQGFTPTLDICINCDTHSELCYLDLTRCGAYCKTCGQAIDGAVNTGEGVLDAIRYITTAEAKKIFAFKLGDKAMEYLSRLGEYLIEVYLEKHFKTLDYLKNVISL